MKIGGLVTDRFAMLQDGIKHDAKNGDKNKYTNSHHEPVQPGLIFRNLGGGGVQVVLSATTLAIRGG